MSRRLILILLLALAASAPAAAQKTPQARSIGKRMMCMCGCNQVLTECNHVGCTVSAEMLAKLDQQVARSEPEDLTIQAFVQEYGQKVLAQPPSTGFGALAWITPGLAAALGTMIVWTLLVRWRRQTATAAPATVAPEVLARVRRELDEENEA